MEDTKQLMLMLEHACMHRYFPVVESITSILAERVDRIDTTTVLGKRVAFCVIDQQLASQTPMLDDISNCYNVVKAYVREKHPELVLKSEEVDRMIVVQKTLEPLRNAENVFGVDVLNEFLSLFEQAQANSDRVTDLSLKQLDRAMFAGLDTLTSIFESNSNWANVLGGRNAGEAKALSTRIHSAVYKVFEYHSWAAFKAEVKSFVAKVEQEFPSYSELSAISQHVASPPPPPPAPSNPDLAALLRSTFRSGVLDEAINALKVVQQQLGATATSPAVDVAVPEAAPAPAPAPGAAVPPLPVPPMVPVAPPAAAPAPVVSTPAPQPASVPPGGAAVATSAPKPGGESWSQEWSEFLDVDSTAIRQYAADGAEDQGKKSVSAVATAPTPAAAAPAPAPAVAAPSTAAATEGESAAKRPRVAASLLDRQANAVQLEFDEASEENSDLSDVPEPSSTGSKPTNRTLPSALHPPTFTPDSSQKRRPWTMEEESTLRKGVSKYGVGNWKEILQANIHIFKTNERTAVNLKDKWRNMTKENP